jgi:redox-sensing transcriptional repressor
MSPKASIGIPMPSLRRLPLYYRHLLQRREAGGGFISSEELGASVGVPGAQVRKDLNYIDEYGKPGVGYGVAALAGHLEDFLGLKNDKEAVLVGVGNLGRALTLYGGFSRYGLEIIALFDKDPAKIGQIVGERQVLPIGKLADLVRRLHIMIGIITVPAEEAQAVADAMVAGGIKAIWNFAPCALSLPSDMYVQNEDLAAQLATLLHHIRRRTA